MKWLGAAIMLLFLLPSACKPGVPQPVPLESTDTCAFCRMAISEPRFAAELVDEAGEALKFDEIGCMWNFVKQHGSQRASEFVVDFDNGQWIKGEEAFYVQSPNINTPMSSGIIAVDTQQKAGSATKKFAGKILKRHLM